MLMDGLNVLRLGRRVSGNEDGNGLRGNEDEEGNGMRNDYGSFLIKRKFPVFVR